MKILILAEPTPAGEKYVERVRRILNALGHDAVWFQREARTPADALILIGTILQLAAECDAVFWDTHIRDWRTGCNIAEVLRKYKVRILELRHLLTMEEGNG